MPLIYDNINVKSSRILVWETTEDDNFFVSALNLNINETEEMQKLQNHRRSEWLTSRYLCLLLDKNTNIRRPVIKDMNNKPFISGSDKHISISHSKNMVAVIHSDVLVGVDIQRHEDKIKRIQHKFISTEEHSHIDTHNLLPSYHIYWGAKESMYKAYGKREIKFSQHMHLYPFRYFSPQLELKGWLKKNKCEQDYDIFTDQIKDFYLVYSILQDES